MKLSEQKLFVPRCWYQAKRHQYKSTWFVHTVLITNLDSCIMCFTHTLGIIHNVCMLYNILYIIHSLFSLKCVFSYIVTGDVALLTTTQRHCFPPFTWPAESQSMKKILCMYESISRNYTTFESFCPGGTYSCKIFNLSPFLKPRSPSCNAS